MAPAGVDARTLDIGQSKGITDRITAVGQRPLHIEGISYVGIVSAYYYILAVIRGVRPDGVADLLGVVRGALLNRYYYVESAGA